MSMPIDLQAKVDDYLAERRRLGFELRSMAPALKSFTSYAELMGNQGPLTIDVMASGRDRTKHRATLWEPGLDGS